MGRTKNGAKNGPKNIPDPLMILIPGYTNVWGVPVIWPKLGWYTTELEILTVRSSSFTITRAQPTDVPVACLQLTPNYQSGAGLVGYVHAHKS